MRVQDRGGGHRVNLKHLTDLQIAERTPCNQGETNDLFKLCLLWSMPCTLQEDTRVWGQENVDEALISLPSEQGARSPAALTLCE